MIILGPNKNKGGIAAEIMKKMKGSPSYEDMKSENEEFTSSKPEEVEKDHSNGYDACCEEMMEAVKSSDNSKFKSALKSFVEMMMNESK
jgi:hypothetical protein